MKCAENISKPKMLEKKEELLELFKIYKNSVKKITQLSKGNYYGEFFEENKKKIK